MDRVLFVLIVPLCATLWVTGCVKHTEFTTGANGDPRSNISRDPRDRRLVMVSNCAFDPFSGEIKRRFEGISHYVVPEPIPDRPGWYAMEGRASDDDWTCSEFHVNASTGEVEEMPWPSWSRAYDDKTRQLIRKNADGSERWRFAQTGQKINVGASPGQTRERNFRAWHYLLRGETMYVSYEHALIAVNDLDGKERWRVPETCGQILLAREYLLAVFFRKNGDDWKEEIRAIDFATGAERFRIPCGENRREERRLYECGSLYASINSSSTTLFDVRGKIILQLDEMLAPIRWRGNIMVTSGKEFVYCWTEAGEQRWKSSIQGGFVKGRSITLLPDGDVLVCNYDAIAAGDAEVARLAGDNGGRRWTATCETYGVAWHSKYSQQAYAEMIDGYVVVVDQQSFCKYVEVLDGNTGKQVLRWPLTERIAGQ